MNTYNPRTVMSMFDMSKEEIEAVAAEATRKAQQELHANGHPYHVGARGGMDAVYPDGRRVFTPYSKKVE